MTEIDITPPNVGRFTKHFHQYYQQICKVPFRKDDPAAKQNGVAKIAVIIAACARECARDWEPQGLARADALAMLNYWALHEGLVEVLGEEAASKLITDNLQAGEAARGSEPEECDPELALITDPELLTEQAVMRRFVLRHKDRLRYDHDAKRWFIWTGHYWKADSKALAFAFALELCRKHAFFAKLRTIKFASDVERAARAQPEVAVESKEWNRDPRLLGTPGGVVDLRTGKLRPGRPEDMINKITECAPAETADCPRFLAFINHALNNNQANIAFLQRYLGYALTGLTSEEKLLDLIGPGGVGKGTLMNTVKNILGDYAASIPITMLTDGAAWRVEYYRAQLVGHRLIIAAEPEKGATWSEAFVNEITGGDPLSGRHPAGQPFTFAPIHKLIVHGNSVPDLKATASGFRRRLLLLPFENPPATPDPDLKEALRAEYPGILRWEIDGCLAWQREKLKPPAIVTERVAEYFVNQDAFGRWVAECCDLEPNTHMPPNVLRMAYNKWAEANGERTMERGNEFHDAVKNCGLPKVTQTKSNGVRIVRGLALKTKPKGELRVLGDAGHDARCTVCNGEGDVKEITDGNRRFVMHIACAREWQKGHGGPSAKGNDRDARAGK